MLGMLLGCTLMAVASELTSLFSVGYWRLARSSDCFLMANLDPTSGERLLLRIVNGGSPESSLRVMFRVGSNEGKVYAIYGLGLIHSPYCRRYLEGFQLSSGVVNMREGSTWRREKVADVAANLRAFLDKKYGRNWEEVEH